MGRQLVGPRAAPVAGGAHCAQRTTCNLGCGTRSCRRRCSTPDTRAFRRLTATRTPPPHARASPKFWPRLERVRRVRRRRRIFARRGVVQPRLRQGMLDWRTGRAHTRRRYCARCGGSPPAARTPSSRSARPSSCGRCSRARRSDSLRAGVHLDRAARRRGRVGGDAVRAAPRSRGVGRRRRRRRRRPHCARSRLVVPRAGAAAHAVARRRAPRRVGGACRRRPRALLLRAAFEVPLTPQERDEVGYDGFSTT